MTRLNDHPPSQPPDSLNGCLKRLLALPLAGMEVDQRADVRITAWGSRRIDVRLSSVVVGQRSRWAVGTCPISFASYTRRSPHPPVSQRSR